MSADVVESATPPSDVRRDETAVCGSPVAVGLVLLLALVWGARGIPVGSYGADEQGYPPWQQEAIDASGAQEPTLLTEAAEPPLEEIIAAESDPILASHPLSTEKVDKLTSDVLVSYVSDEATRDQVASDLALQAMQQIQDGTVASVVGESYISSARRRPRCP